MRSARNTGTLHHQQHSSPTRGSKSVHGSRSIRILLADDQVIFRKLLRTWLLSNPDIDVVGETGNVKDVAHLAGTLHPTLVLMEIFFSGIHGIAGIREMKSLYPRIKILVLTAHLSDTTVQAAMQAGASGLLEKSASLEEVWSAIDNVIAGKTYLCPRAAEIVARGYAGNSRGPLDMLTPREHEALRCIAGGMRNKDIALHLGISVNTVEKHRANLMDKLNLRKVASLTALAIQQGVSTISATPNKRATGVVEAARATDWDRAMPPPHTKKRAAS